MQAWRHTNQQGSKAGSWDLLQRWFGASWWTTFDMCWSLDVLPNSKASKHLGLGANAGIGGDVSFYSKCTVEAYFFTVFLGNPRHFAPFAIYLGVWQQDSYNSSLALDPKPKMTWHKAGPEEKMNCFLNMPWGFAHRQFVSSFYMLMCSHAKAHTFLHQNLAILEKPNYIYCIAMPSSLFHVVFGSVHFSCHVALDNCFSKASCLHT